MVRDSLRTEVWWRGSGTGGARGGSMCSVHPRIWAALLAMAGVGVGFSMSSISLGLGGAGLVSALYHLKWEADLEVGLAEGGGGLANGNPEGPARAYDVGLDVGSGSE